MSDSYNPKPWQTQNPSSAPTPMRVQVNVKLPADVSHSDKIVLMDVAHSIVNGNSAQIDRFVANNRQQVSSSGMSYYKRSMSGQGMDAHYISNSGDETLRMNVYPAGGGRDTSTTSETNPDGYICWVHGEGLGPVEDLIGAGGIPQKPSPWTIILNGYQIDKNFYPKLNETHCSFYPILFGRTAMLCGSQQDKTHKNTLLQNRQLKPPNVVVPAQGWGFYPDGSAPDGTDQSKDPRYLGYWLFDWENALNPWQYVKNLTNDPGFWTNWEGGFTGFPGAYIGIPKGSRGCYFRDTNKSPLKPQGQNKISVLDATPAGPQIVTLGYDLFFGEFYDRGKFRTVTQSWTQNAPPRWTININDSPLIYGAAFYHRGYASSGGGMQFDLSSQTTKAGPTGSYQDALMGPHDKIYTSLVMRPDQPQDKPDPLFQYNVWGLSDDQVNTLTTWLNQHNGSANAGILAQIATLDNQITTGSQQVVLLEAVNAYVYAAGVNDPVNVIPPVMLALVQQAHKDTLKVYPTLVDPSAYANTITTLNGLIAQYNTNNLENFHTDYVALHTTLDDSISALDDTITQEKNQVAQLDDQLTPVTPPTDFPDLGDSISEFTHSYITINGTDWSYEQ